MRSLTVFRIALFLVTWHLILSAPFVLALSVGKSEDENQTKLKKIHHNALFASSTDINKKEGEMDGKDKLTEVQGNYLLGEARRTIEQKLFDREGPKESDSDLPAAFHERRGTFVTLTKEGNLRGCIGHIVPQESLIEGIRVNAINAAFRDPRFQPLSGDEWDKIKIEVSILTEPKPLSYADSNDLLKKLRPGIDGVIIKKGFYQSTFLPQVWEQLPGKEQFLNHLCHKAGLAGEAWQNGDLEVSTYQVQAFEE